ncbi:unnamed protein product, partial [Brassica oleracea var. botrytis]
MGWRFPFVLNFAGSLFFLSSSTRAEEHRTSRTCETAKRLQKVAIRVFGAVLHLKAAFVTAERFKSSESGFGGCGVNGGGSMLSQSSFPQPKF